jgi:hypothetical protein
MKPFRMNGFRMNRDPSPAERTVRMVLVAGGVGVGLVGVYAFVTSVPVRQWIGVGVWLGGGVAVHDALLAPASVVLGWLVVRRSPQRWRPALRTGLLAVATVLVIALPLAMTASLSR